MPCSILRVRCGTSYYAPVFGVRDATLLGIYSPMINLFLCRTTP